MKDKIKQLKIQACKWASENAPSTEYEDACDQKFADLIATATIIGVLKMNEKKQQTTTPTHSWGKITEVDGGFNGDPENEYVNQKIWPLNDDTDALRWATEFANKFTVWSNDGVEPDTKGLMIAWFANAIMAGVDNAIRLEQSKYVELHQWRRIDIPKQSGWFDDTIQRAYHTDGRLEGRTVYVKKVDDK